jgi:hypothetical protein
MPFPTKSKQYRNKQQDDPGPCSLELERDRYSSRMIIGIDIDAALKLSYCHKLK